MNKKELIQSDAAKLFLNKGYKETSLREIIEDTGTSKGCLFHHFKNKAALGLAVETDLISKMQISVEQLFPDEPALFHFIAMQRLGFRLFFEEPRVLRFLVELLEDDTYASSDTSNLANEIVSRYVEKMSSTQVILSKCIGNMYFKGFLPEISHHLDALNYDEVFRSYVSSLLSVWHYPEEESHEMINKAAQYTNNMRYILQENMPHHDISNYSFAIAIVSC